MKKRSLKFFFFTVLVLLSPVFSQDAQPSKPSTIQTLSLEIRLQLQSLKMQSENLTERLQEAENDLKLSSETVERLKMDCQDLNSSLILTNQKLTDSSKKLIEYEEKLLKTKEQLKMHRRINIICTLILIAMILIKISIMYLKWKYKISIPYWLNCLL